MSEDGVARAVERILADPALAVQAFDDPEKALESFDLDDAERERIATALRVDLEPQLAGHEVSGFGATPGFSFPSLKMVPVLRPTTGDPTRGVEFVGRYPTEG